ncbi:MAG TPA: urea carboxylase [Methyloceanibacter sp.]
MFHKVLIANRGAVACRIIGTLDRMGIGSVAVYSEADRHSKNVRMAGEAVAIGPSPAAESYLKIEAILDAALKTGAEAIHPGYGFLAENSDFAKACAEAGIVFIGPKPEHIRAFGLKHKARELAVLANVPLAPGSGLIADIAHAEAEAQRISYPVMIKSTAGGGGIGLQLVRSPDEIATMFERVERLARNNFKDAGMFIEKYVERGRHIEVQIFGDGKGNVIALGERDCSAQRRHQKVIEETPAPNLPEKTRQALWETACRLGRSVNYESAGTVEYLYDAETEEFYFLEVNTRLQVEHGVTEEVNGIDLVEWMVRQAAGVAPPLDQGNIKPQGSSIEVRLYAEDPGRDFRPSSGLLTHVSWPEGIRVETWVESGTEVSPFYDPMLAKIIVNGDDRDEALGKLKTALDATEIGGLETNLDYLRQLARLDVLARGEMLTRTLQAFTYQAETIEVLSPGTQTTIQDWPGRVGYWAVGVPPSGPMDSLSFRLANRLVGNDQDVAGIETTLSGPILKFNTDTVICLGGAELQATLDGNKLPYWRAVAVKSGQELKLGNVKGPGVRAYIAVRGGIDVPKYLGSRSTFTLGKFGGHAGRTLRTGDVLHIGASLTDPPESVPLPEALKPLLAHVWDIGVLYGPHGAPDFFTSEYIDTFFGVDWEVHYNSNPTGVRLIGPKPGWAREDGGEAGLHPSNIHDNAYAVGTIDFTGDMPVILGPDGPSLGGFVCPVTIAQAELWKIGQLRPGDKIRFVRLTPAEAARRLAKQDAEIAALRPVRSLRIFHQKCGTDGCIVGGRDATGKTPRVTYRRAGDAYLLIEYGPIILDFRLRFRVHALMQAVDRVIGFKALVGIIDQTPGIRSLQIHYDPRLLALDDLIATLETIEDELGDLSDMEVDSRLVRLPVSWNDEAVQLTIDKYMRGVRANAPWCPSNIEFIRRINGLDSIDDVKRIVFDATYLVLGLGDVYLGAPVATPVDPRHRLVTTKYNPARTWTPENVVGIGGAYLCIYGMEGPGGYQLFGRTCQMWNNYRATDAFEEHEPWLLRFFDRIEFYSVSDDELLDFRDGFLEGARPIDIVRGRFRLKDYLAFLDDNTESIAAFKTKQQTAFEEERARWREATRVTIEIIEETIPEFEADGALPFGATAVESPVPGSIWKILVEPGCEVAEGETLIIVESMKMEIAVCAPASGLVQEVRCAEGRSVQLGQALVILGGAAA